MKSVSSVAHAAVWPHLLKGTDMADNIEVTRQDEETKGAWRAVVDGHVAEMTYSRVSAALIIVDHTEVPDALRGRSVGVALVRQAVADARAEGFKIAPLCPFAKAQFDKHPEWADVRR